MTWFCLACFAELTGDFSRCPTCGADLDSIRDEEFERKLLRALDHRLPDRRVLAARSLSLRRCVAAVDRLISIVLHDDDPYVVAAAVSALAAIGDPEGMAVVLRMAEEGPAVARAAARRALEGC